MLYLGLEHLLWARRLADAPDAGDRPEPRSESAVAHMFDGRFAVVFGERFSDLANDIWVFDPALTSWDRLYP